MNEAQRFATREADICNHSLGRYSTGIRRDDLPWPDNHRIHLYSGIRCRYSSPHDPAEMWEELLRCDPTGKDHCESFNGTPRPARHDTVLVWKDAALHGVDRFWVARLMLLFGLDYHGQRRQLAYVKWYEEDERASRSNEPGMLVLEQRGTGEVIHISSIVRGCHLLPCWGPRTSSRATTLARAGRKRAPESAARFLLNKHLDRWSYWELYN